MNLVGKDGRGRKCLARFLFLYDVLTQFADLARCAQ